MRAAEVTELDLGGAWQLHQDKQVDAIPATVPGCVHLDLLAAGKIPDPFYRDNQKTLQWIGDATWTYTRHINVPADFLARPHILLRCEGLDTIADIRINGRPVASTENMYRTYEFDVKDKLTAGDNSIEVVFNPVVPYIKKFISQATGHLSSTKGMANVRKAPYSNGWDFGPKFLTAGIYRKIRLVAFDDGRLLHQSVTTHIASDGKVSTGVDVSFEHADAPLSVAVSVSFHGATLATQSAPASGNGVHFDIPVENPQLWWPAGMGAQPLYDLDVTLKDPAGHTIDRRQTRFGLRKIELLPKSDTRPLRLAVNGREIFAKGTDWIPADMFAPRVTSAQLHRYVADAVAANMNMIRCWGGGYYEDDAFFDACDEMGLLVWSEFEFACATYPSGNPEFVENVRAEVSDQVNRLRNHPCMAVWCGNNEVTAQITGYKILKQADYDFLFHGVIGAEVAAMMPDANYVGGSPEAGDEHNWWVWHVGANFEKYNDSHGWMTEFGFQSLPCPATVASFTEPADRTSVLSPVMKAHQHNGNGRGTEMILDQMGRYFHSAKDFDSTLWLSQINQAYGITMGIEHWRSDWPRSSGSLVWQYDDCWPGASWSSVDYFGRWKAMQYKLRDAFAPLMVTAHYNPATSEAEVNVCSDLANGCSADLRWRLTDTEGKPIADGRFPVAVPAGTCSVKCPGISVMSAITTVGLRNALLWLELENDGVVVSRKTVWFVRPKNLGLVDPAIHSAVVAAGDGYDISLKAAHPALWAWVDLTGDPDVRYSDNFIHLPGDQVMTIHIVPKRSISQDELTKNLHVQSLFDTFAPVANVANSDIKPAIDGSIFAAADQAEIIGNSAALEAGNPPNIGRWSDPTDELDWTFTADHAGKYQVSIDLACPTGMQGSAIAVRVGGTKIDGVVPVTGGWTNYKVVDFGIVSIDKAGLTSLRLGANRMPHGHVMNLRSITLKPVKAGE